MTLYPDGYGTRLVTLEQMVATHGAKMHPEFARRFFPWIVTQGGKVGVGGGWRSIQPAKPGFARDGESFHQDQRFASGFVGYAAVDLVHVNPGQVHRAPTWAESASAPEFGLHTFIKAPKPEPWHMQCIEMRGWRTWVDAGRPDPARFALPSDAPTNPPTTTEDCNMIAIDYTAPSGQWTALTYTGSHLAHVRTSEADAIIRRANVQRQTVTAAELDALILSAATTTHCPPEWVNTSRGAAWTAQRA